MDSMCEDPCTEEYSQQMTFSSQLKNFHGEDTSGNATCTWREKPKCVRFEPYPTGQREFLRRADSETDLQQKTIILNLSAISIAPSDQSDSQGPSQIRRISKSSVESKASVPCFQNGLSGVNSLDKSVPSTSDHHLAQTLSNSFCPEIHTACWQDDYRALVDLMQKSNALTVKNLEEMLLKIVSVPSCLRRKQGSCPHPHVFERNSVSSNCFSQPKKSPAIMHPTFDEAAGLPRESILIPNQLRQLKRQIGSWDYTLHSASENAQEGVACSSHTANVDHRRAMEAGAELATCSWVPGGALELGVKSGSLRCVNLLLTILFLRKLVALGLVASKSVVLSNVWNKDPFQTAKKAMARLGGAFKPYIRGFLRLPSHLCTFVLSCLVGQPHVVRLWELAPLRFVASQGGDVRLLCLLASAVLGGDPHIIRSVALWFLPEMTGDVIASVCCLVLKMARLLNLNNVPMAISFLAVFHLFQEYNCIFLNFLRGMNTVFMNIPHRHDGNNRKGLTKNMEMEAEEVCRYAGFLFDSSVLQGFALQVFDRRECIAMDSFLYNKTRLDVPKVLRAHCNRVFMDLCQRGAAGSFLLSLEAESSTTLNSLASPQRERLILCLLQYIRATDRESPTVNASCSLCACPIFSFLIWITHRADGLLQDLSVEELSWYDRSILVHLSTFSQMSCPTSRLDLCGHHVDSVRRNVQETPAFVHRMLEAQKTKTLKALALFCVVDHLDQLRHTLMGPAVPGAIRDFFYLEREFEGI